jgi:hypothetical protein
LAECAVAYVEEVFEAVVGELIDEGCLADSTVTEEDDLVGLLGYFGALGSRHEYKSRANAHR